MPRSATADAKIAQGVREKRCRKSGVSHRTRQFFLHARSPHSLFISRLSWLLLNRYRQATRETLIIASYIPVLAPSFLPPLHRAFRPAHLRVEWQRQDPRLLSTRPALGKGLSVGWKKATRGEKIWDTPIIIFIFDFADCVNSNWISRVFKMLL